MASKKDLGLTSGITGFLLGATDQQLIHQAGAGNLGPLTPAQAQGGLGGVAVVAGAVTKLLSKRESVWTRIADGGLIGGAFALGQSAMHQADRMMANNAAATASNPAASTTSAAPSTDSGTSTSTTGTASTTTNGTVQNVAMSDPSYESIA